MRFDDPVGVVLAAGLVTGILVVAAFVLWTVYLLSRGGVAL